MAKITFVDGVAYRGDKVGKQRIVNDVDIPEFNDCCKLDCCAGEAALKIPDRTTGEVMLLYFLDGDLIFEDAAGNTSVVATVA